jgi:hypothetical protein
VEANHDAPAVASSEIEIAAPPVWRFEPRDGGTPARTEESFEGLLPRLLRGRMQRMLQQSLDSGLAYLRAEAERRAAG